MKRSPRYREWESGDQRPTLEQVEEIANSANVPIGSFFLSRPLKGHSLIPDLRTDGDRPICRQPSMASLEAG